MASPHTMHTTAIDTLIEARWIIPVEPSSSILTEHAIAVHQGVIQTILPIPEARSRYQPAQHVTLKQHALIPGLINLHTHAAMTLMRGLADDLPLMTWLKQHIWPAEARFVDERFVREGTQLACAEMLKGGITCFNDMYFFPAAAAEVVTACGLRAGIGLVVIDFLSAYASDADDYLAKGLALRDQYPRHPLLTFCLAPHAPYSVNDKTLSKVMTLAEQLQLPVHIHVHETQAEIDESLTTHGIRPLMRLQRLGLLGPNLIAAHMVHLNEEEISLFNQYGGHVAHCPTSNLKLASGIAPITTLLQQGVNVGLGTDGAASNNRLDIFEEMRLCALLAKGFSGQADALPAWQALRLATLNGAKALGLEQITGSLVAGKAADIVAVDFSELELSPCYDPVSHLVYTAGREQVTHVWINGQLLLDNKELVTLRESELLSHATYWQKRLTS